MLGIVFPVGGDEKAALGPELFPKQAGKIRLDQAAFVVTLFRPRVGKEDVDPIQAFILDLAFKHYGGILSNKADIF